MECCSSTTASTVWSSLRANIGVENVTLLCCFLPNLNAHMSETIEIDMKAKHHFTSFLLSENWKGYIVRLIILIRGYLGGRDYWGCGPQNYRCLLPLGDVR